MEKRLTIIEHLEELRKRALISLIAIAISGFFSFPFAKKILKILKHPAGNLIEKLAYFSPQEAFLVYIKAAFFCGLILSMPVILYQLWAFIEPAIGKNVKRFTLGFVLSALVAFILGCLFAYFVILPLTLKFLIEFAGNQLMPVISVNRYLSFVVGITLGCGLVFQMPVLSFILAKINIINTKFLIRKFKYALLSIFIIAAVITPTPDIFNMFVLAIPMLFLYLISIIITGIAQPKNAASIYPETSQDKRLST